MDEAVGTPGNTWEQWLDIANAHEERGDDAEADAATAIAARLQALAGAARQTRGCSTH